MIKTTTGVSFNLLEATTHIPLKPKLVRSPKQSYPYLPNSKASSTRIAVDFEASGLDVLEEGYTVVGISFAWEGCPEGTYVGLDFEDDGASLKLLQFLCGFQLIAHNVGYDGRVMEWIFRTYDLSYNAMSVWPWINDTLLQFKALANEGFKGQSWSLKAAQLHVLGWTETNEKLLDEWLITNGHVNSKGKPLKGKMSLAPFEILGHYGALDSQSTYALHCHFNRFGDCFPDLVSILENEFMTLLRLEIEEYFRGMWIDRTLLENRMTSIKDVMSMLLESFVERSEATPYIELFNQNKRSEILNRQPEQFTKTGKIASRYLKWETRVEETKSTNFFNVNSKPQLVWLFYECIFKSTEVETTTNRWGDEVHKFNVMVGDEVFIVDGTDKGKKRIDKKILGKLGIAGKLLTRYNELAKLLSYMQSMLDSLDEDSLHHTGLRAFGTLTGRCSGASLKMKGSKETKVNVQQLPKVREYLDCLKPRPGYKFIQMDVDALEPVVLAELSEDDAMMKLFGPNAKPNDIYLFVGASIPALKDEVCKYGYDPNNPTKEAIKITKKKAKRIRNICKVVHLSAGYGAGATTIHNTLTQCGITITIEEVRGIHKAYWKLFSGVTTFQSKLLNEYNMNGGWFLNGRMLPISVAGHLEKDILNRCIQSTGHYNLLTYLKHLEVLRRSSPHLELHPILVDFHDETIWEVPEAQAEEAMELFRKTWDLTNEELGGIIPLSGAPEICTCFSEFKCEGGYRLAEIIEEFNLEGVA